MRWYLNDASLQGQFDVRADFESVLRGLIAARAKIPAIRQNLRSTRSLPEALVDHCSNVRQVLHNLSDKDLKSAIYLWLDKTGPFVDDDRLDEIDDYFEYRCVDVTDTGLGEAARRTKAGTECTVFSFQGGDIDYAINQLEVDHGLPEKRYGRYFVTNLWQVEALKEQAITAEVLPYSWPTLIDYAKRRFPNLEIGAIDTNPALARETFGSSLRDRSLELMKILNDYVAGRTEEGKEGLAAREIVATYFTGDRALFSGESASNRNDFTTEMTFQRVSGGCYFSHWHGKISHRVFRMHFEWPLEKDRKKLEIFYLYSHD